MRLRRHETHSGAFREEAVRQAREFTQPLTTLARDLGVKYSTLRLWVKQAAALSDERISERDILKKATAFFAKHSQ